MQRNRMIIVGVGALVVGAVGYQVLHNRHAAMDRFIAKGAPSAQVTSDSDNSTDNATRTKSPVSYCPAPENIVKTDLNWSTKDGKWSSYTPSSATKVVNFVSAQWLGIKVGKVICLYQTDEAVAFPLALEQTSSQLIVEPSDAGWSALIGNYKLCKSANVADCPYYVEAPKNIANVYDEIKYNPAATS